MNFRNLLVKVGRVVGRAALKFEPSGIASGLLEAYTDHNGVKQLRDELQAMIATGFDQFRDELRNAIEELRQEVAPGALKEVESYLSLFQSSAKQASRALGDPSATTVPATVAVDSPEELATFLPPRKAQFTCGDSVPGLPSWTLVEPLGAGGFGEVWKAVNPFSGTAAFKFFLDPIARNRFTRTEATNLAEITRRGPTDGVVKLLMAEPGQEPPWLQFEYISGGDLSRLVGAWKGKPDAERVRQATLAVRALAKTVGHFHNHGVVHRDLKPGNVLLRKTETGYRLVVADFGISRILPTGRGGAVPVSSGNATIRAYTALYASPQQQRFEPADKRDDVYALGVMWYQLLRGDLGLKHPSGESWKRALRDIGVGADAVGLLNRCWDDDPGERPVDGNDLYKSIVELNAHLTPVNLSQGKQTVEGTPTTAATAVPNRGQEPADKEPRGPGSGEPAEAIGPGAAVDPPKVIDWSTCLSLATTSLGSNDAAAEKTAEAGGRAPRRRSLVSCKECGTVIARGAATCPRCGIAWPAEITGTLRIVREWGLSGLAHTVQVFVDEDFMGSVNNGETLSLNLSVGKRLVTVMGGGMTRKLVIAIEEREVASYQVYFSTWGVIGGGLNFKTL